MKCNTILFVMLFSVVLPACALAIEEEAVPPAQDSSGTGAVSQPKDKLPWWPTDAQPAPVKDEQRGGFWWWPSSPGTAAKDLWGNRGYAYVNKIIYDWRGSGAVKSVQVRISDVGFVGTEEKPSLLVKRTIRNQKLKFKAALVEIGPEHAVILKKAVESLKRNKEASMLIAPQSDTAGLANVRIQSVEKFLTDQGVLKERIKILPFGKLQEAGLSVKHPPEEGSLQFVIAEVKEVMIPGPKN